MLISIIIHTLILASVYYLNLVNESGSEVTKVSGVNTLIGTKINIKMIAADKTSSALPKQQRSLSTTKNTVTNTTNPKPAAVLLKTKTKTKTEIAFTKKETSDISVVKKIIKASNKTEKNEIVKNITNKDNQADMFVAKTNNAINKKAKEQTFIAQKGLLHTGDNINKSQINTGNSNDPNTPWNQYKTAIFSAINAQKVYPKQARLRRSEGTVVVKFDITKLGNMSGFTLIQKVDSEHLNRSTKHLFEQLYLPKRPEAVIGFLPVTLTVPIEYSLN
jgi:TonB family protein